MEINEFEKYLDEHGIKHVRPISYSRILYVDTYLIRYSYSLEELMKKVGAKNISFIMLKKGDFHGTDDFINKVLIQIMF